MYISYRLQSIMPAATVGSAYSGQKDLERTQKPYKPEKGYSSKELIEVLKIFSGLEFRVLSKEGKEELGS